MNIDPSEIIYFQWGFVRITATLVFTWVIVERQITVSLNTILATN